MCVCVCVCVCVSVCLSVCLGANAFIFKIEYISVIIIYLLMSHFLFYVFHSVQFSSVAQSCPTLCNPMNCSTPGLPAHHQLLDFTNSRPSSRCCCPQSLPASESFPMSQLFTWGGQSIGVSALASFLPKKSQGWSPSEWTGWISLQSKGLSRVFSNTTVQKHQFFGAQVSL